MTTRITTSKQTPANTALHGLFFFVPPQTAAATTLYYYHTTLGYLHCPVSFAFSHRLGVFFFLCPFYTIIGGVFLMLPTVLC
jgi:hypothetical protein